MFYVCTYFFDVLFVKVFILKYDKFFKHVILGSTIFCENLKYLSVPDRVCAIRDNIMEPGGLSEASAYISSFCVKG